MVAFRTQPVAHDGSHPFEREVATYTQHLLETQRWPFDRIGVDIQFVLFSSQSSSFRAKRVALIEDKPNGVVDLLFNHLFLMQRPGRFLETVVVHELAHVLSRIEAMRNNRAYKYVHDDAFCRMHRSLSKLEVLSHAQLNEPFDNRAILLFSDYAPARCNCRGDSGFHVLGKKKKKSAADKTLTCDACGSAIRLTDHRTLPKRVTRDLDYLKHWKQKDRAADE